MELSAIPSTRSGRKCIWKALTTVSVRSSKNPGDGNIIAIDREHRLQRLNRLPLIPALEETPPGNPLRLDPMANATLGKSLPWEVHARINLAARGHIGMTKDTIGRNVMAFGDILGEHDQRCNLLGGIIILATIGNLDADGTAV